MDLEEKLRNGAQQAVDIAERVMRGEETLTPVQARMATLMLTGYLKEESNRNGRTARMISLARFVRDAGVRERVAMVALREIVPELALPPSPSSDPSSPSDDRGPNA